MQSVSCTLCIGSRINEICAPHVNASRSTLSRKSWHGRRWDWDDASAILPFQLDPGSSPGGLEHGRSLVDGTGRRKRQPWMEAAGPRIKGNDDERGCFNFPVGSDVGAVCLGVPCIVCPSAAGTQITPCARALALPSEFRSDPAGPHHSLGLRGSRGCMQ